MAIETRVEPNEGDDIYRPNGGQAKLNSMWTDAHLPPVPCDNETRLKESLELLKANNKDLFDRGRILTVISSNDWNEQFYRHGFPKQGLKEQLRHAGDFQPPARANTAVVALELDRPSTFYRAHTDFKDSEKGPFLAVNSFDGKAGLQAHFDQALPHSNIPDRWSEIEALRGTVVWLHVTNPHYEQHKYTSENLTESFQEHNFSGARAADERGNQYAVYLEDSKTLHSTGRIRVLETQRNMKTPKH